MYLWLFSFYVQSSIFAEMCNLSYPQCLQILPVLLKLLLLLYALMTTNYIWCSPCTSSQLLVRPSNMPLVLPLGQAVFTLMPDDDLPALQDPPAADLEQSPVAGTEPPGLLVATEHLIRTHACGQALLVPVNGEVSLGR